MSARFCSIRLASRTPATGSAWTTIVKPFHSGGVSPSTDGAAAGSGGIALRALVARVGGGGERRPLEPVQLLAEAVDGAADALHDRLAQLQQVADLAADVGGGGGIDAEVVGLGRGGRVTLGGLGPANLLGLALERVDLGADGLDQLQRAGARLALELGGALLGRGGELAGVDLGIADRRGGSLGDVAVGLGPVGGELHVRRLELAVALGDGRDLLFERADRVGEAADLVLEGRDVAGGGVGAVAGRGPIAAGKRGPRAPGRDGQLDRGRNRG